MILATKCEGWVSGLWRFSNVFVEEVVDFARQWKETEPEACRRVSVRKCSKEQLGVDFEYQLPGGETFEQFVYRLTDRLKRRFGNQYLGYDVSGTTWLIGAVEVASGRVPTHELTDEQWRALDEGLNSIADYPSQILGRPNLQADSALRLLETLGIPRVRRS
jgi:hypothetical protein